MPPCLANSCRTCLHKTSDDLTTNSKQEQMVSLDSTVDDVCDNVKIMNIIKAAIPQLKLEKNDYLPNSICLQCLAKIKDIYTFQENCVKVEQKFFEMLEVMHLKDKSYSNSDMEDVFLEENSFQSDLFIDEDASKDEVEALSDMEDFIESCSESSIDFVLDDDSDNDVMDCQNDQQRRFFPCDKCQSILKSEISFRNHMRKHSKKDSGQSKCVCQICSRVFSQAYMLRDHLRSHTGEKPFLCSECGKGLTTSSSLKQHLLRHQSEKLFSCSECPKTFPTRTDLSSHFDVHKARPKNHICDVCGRGFQKAFILKKHKMSHTSERPFPCDFCEKRFLTNEKLQRHTRIHTGEKPYKCKYCDRAYCQSNELTKHLRCHLGENVYQCRLCPRRYPTAKMVKEHFSSHKNDDELTRSQNLAQLNAMEIKGIFCR